MTLALLLTAATGAWAQEETLLTTITATGTDSYSEETPGVVTVTHDNSHFDGTYGWLWWSHAGSITVEAKEGYTITRCVFRQPYKSPFTVSTAPFKVDFIQASDPDMPEFKQYLCNGDWYLNMDGVSTIEVYGYVPAPAADPDAIDVTTNAAEEGATFTEASFLMPTSDATVDYELVRDMSVKMTAQVGDGSDGYRIRIKKDGNDYVPVNTEDMLISVSDELDKQHPDLTVNTDFTLLVQKKGEGDTWTDLSNEDKLSVGTFRYKVTGVGNYDGTIYSNEFKLFEGYELKIAAGEYATYYKDEALYVEDEDAKLYTITTVSNETATATELTVAAAYTPLLVKNNAAEAKTILLIPTTTATSDDVTPYEGFKGTLEATQIAASTATQNNYALNGKEFVWVMDAIDIAANRAWLEIPATTTNGRALTIVFGDVTGLTPANIAKAMNGDWYTLDGMKLQAAPTKKGVYILNGKKVVVK